MYASERFDAQIEKLLTMRDEKRRMQLARELTRTILDEAPHIWLPTPYAYAAWWPWVKNYGGELFAGAQRPGPIYARLWIDRELKRAMGFE